MSDGYRLRIVRTPGFEEEPAEEIVSLQLRGSMSSAVEDLYRHTALQTLAENQIYAWKVHDERNFLNTGASAEMRDVIIFLTGAASATLTSELVKRIVDAIQAVAQRILGTDEIGDDEALSLATLHRVKRSSYAHLISYRRLQSGNRIFDFSDGFEVEISRSGSVVSSEFAQTDEPND